MVVVHQLDHGGQACAEQRVSGASELCDDLIELSDEASDLLDGRLRFGRGCALPSGILRVCKFRPVVPDEYQVHLPERAVAGPMQCIHKVDATEAVFLQVVAHFVEEQ